MTLEDYKINTKAMYMINFYIIAKIDKFTDRQRINGFLGWEELQV